MIQVIGISGKQGAGKTTLSKILEDKLDDRFDNVVVHRLRFAHYIYLMHDKIREVLSEHREGLEGMGINYPFDKKDGNLLQLLGTEWGRNVDENIWAALTKLEIDNIFSGPIVGTLPFVMLEDMRFENEFNILPSNIALKVRLEASEDVRRARAEMWRENTSHPSEVGLDTYADDGKFDMYFRADKEPPEAIADSIVDKIEESIHARRASEEPRAESQV